jgi:diguanylate cyclase (GGDEF)-like protein
LKNACDFDRAKHKGLRDQLTGLPNIEHLYQLTNSYNSPEASGEPFSILLLDVDGLSAINEQFGQAFGDQVLARVVLATRHSLRTADLMFRFRDDEFIVLLFQTDAETAHHVAKRVRDTLRRESAVVNPQFSVTVAVATSPGDADTIHDLITSASARLRTNSVSRPLGSGADSVH